MKEEELRGRLKELQRRIDDLDKSSAVYFVCLLVVLTAHACFK